jgi:alpha,alpha-trehalase
MKGLLKSEMAETAKGVLLNLFALVEKYNFIPNGGRIYYINRSQPPLLSEMVREYYEATQDVSILLKGTLALEKEYSWWMDNRSYPVPLGPNRAVKLNRYSVDTSIPRPESFREDFSMASNKTDEEKIRFYQGVAAAAETGWDFSERWLKVKGDFSSINPSEIIPVDLNAFMFTLERNMEQFYSRLLSEKEKGSLPELQATVDEIQRRRFFFSKAQIDRIDAMNKYLWCDRNGTVGYFDFDVQKEENIILYYGSIFTPLWAKSYYRDEPPKTRLDEMIRKLDEPLKTFPGGVPTSLIDSGPLKL